MKRNKQRQDIKKNNSKSRYKMFKSGKHWHMQQFRRLPVLWG
ncbi:KxYKxGKxW signal peptide domain-containing protein [Secundilactobacillus similis]